MENQGTNQRASEFPPAENFPLSTPAQTSVVDSQSLMEKEQNLMRWEQELRDRERVLESQHNANLTNANESMAGTSTYGMNNNNMVVGTQSRAMGPANFPSFYPVTRFSVAEDIPAANQRLVRLSAATFGVISIALIWNFAVSIGALTIGAVGNFFLALFYMLVGIPFAFFVHRRFYRAARSGKPSAQYGFLLAYLGLIAMVFIFWLGFKKSGMHGLIWMINLFHNDHDAVGAMNVFSFFFWTVALILVVGIFFKVLRTNNTRRQTGEMQYGGFREYIKSR